MNARLELVPVTVLGALMAGMVHALFGAIREPLAQRLNLDAGQAGWLRAVWYAGLLPVLLIAGMLVDRLGVEWVLIAGFLSAAVAIALLGMSSSQGLVMGLLLLLGAATAAVLASAVALMPVAFGPEQPVAAVNLGAFLLFIGVLLTPLFVNRLLPTLGLRRTLGAFALIALAPTLLAALTAGDAFPTANGGDLGRVFTDPVMLLTAAAYFLYVPIELTVRNWSSAYLSHEGYTPRRAGAWLLAFWISFLAGRLATAWFVYQTSPTVRVEPWLVLSLIVLVAVALGNLASAAGHYSAGFGLPMVGLVMGPILPTLLGIALHHFPNEPGTAFASVYAIGTVGTLTLMPVIGPYSRGAVAFRMPLLLAIAAGTMTLALALVIR